MNMRPPLVVIAGATATGKSALALDLAERRHGVVINADASQVYADLQILTARPSSSEVARAPHRLYGIVDGAAACSAAMWADMARVAIANAHSSGQLPILVGGTGLYLRTLLDGIAPVPEIDPAVRAAVRALPPEALHPLLVREDPLMAARLHPSDRQRLARALEVVRCSGRSLATWQSELRGGIRDRVEPRLYVVEVDRATLYMRCDHRFDAMMASGALDEVAALARRGLDPRLPVMKAIGVPPLLAYLQGTLPLAAAVIAAKQATRTFAKRQLTWFRNQTPGWMRIDGMSGQIAE